MSGIVCWIASDRHLESSRSTLLRMTRTLSPRGPDGEGLWLERRAGIGHRLLASEDRTLSTQPHVRTIGGASVVITIDGEVYNKSDLLSALKDKGHEFRSCSAAEVVLNAYLTWGVEAFSKLVGMYSIAIWDSRDESLRLIRDRIGMRPLYYWQVDGETVVGSEPKAIMAHPRFHAVLRPTAIPIVLQPRIALAGETPIDGMHEVPPASIVTIRDGRASIAKYWSLASTPHTDSFNETKANVRRLLTDAVESQLPEAGSIESVSAMLSGGLDSSSVSALCSRAFHANNRNMSLSTYCVQFAESPKRFEPTELRPDVDAPYAEAMAAHLNANHNVVELTAEQVLAAVPETRLARDLPGWGQFDASNYLLYKSMREGSSVAITGETADELFGGYPFFLNQDAIASDNFPWIESGPKLGDYLSKELRSQFDVREDEKARYSQLLSESPRLPGESIEEARMREVFYVSSAGRQAVLLDRMDRLSMRAGIEVRLPFCDHSLIEYTWNIPWAMKSKDGLKSLLKAAMQDLLPDAVLNRKKSAFPHIQCGTYDKAIISEAREIVNDSQSPTSLFFDTALMSKMIDELDSSDKATNASHILIQFVELDAWMRTYAVSFEQ